MSTARVIVPYEHDSADLGMVELAVAPGGFPYEDAWVPAYRDTVDGQKVVCARFDVNPGQIAVWLRDRDGVRRINGVFVGDPPVSRSTVRGTRISGRQP